MADYCTIYTQVREQRKALEALRRISPVPLEILGTKIGTWERACVRTPHAVLTFNALERQAPLDEASRQLLTMFMYINNIRTEREDRKTELKSRIIETDLIIGVVAEPEFSEDAGHFACVQAVAEAVDGLIFNGSALMDAQGYTLLDGDGNCDV